MSALQKTAIKEGIEWAVGSFVSSPADVVIPVHTLSKLTDDEVNFIKSIQGYEKNDFVFGVSDEI